MTYFTVFGYVGGRFIHAGIDQNHLISLIDTPTRRKERNSYFHCTKNKVILCVIQTLTFLFDGDETERRDLGANLGLALKVGEVNIRVMELLDKGHCTRFGSPEPTAVSLIPTEGKVRTGD